jgi:cyclic pyranopterin phosphate synthase
MAAAGQKSCPNFVPICGTKNFETDEANVTVHCKAQVETYGKTGVEMEALTAVQIGLLTVYDMCKAVDRGMVMSDIRVTEKHGGKSGDWSATS